MSREGWYELAADALLVFHSLFVLFVVGSVILILVGGFRRWHWVRNPLFRWFHLAAVAVVVVQSWLGLICPLTIWEVALRQKAGVPAYEGSLIARWLDQLLYYHAPDWVFIVVYTVFGALVIASWLMVRPDAMRRAAG